MPLHPMLVHFPIVLAIIIPLAMITAIVLSKKTENHRKVWAIIFSLCLFLTVSSFIAGEAGENEEERVEKIVTKQAFEEHEEAAEVFTWATILPLLLAGLIMFKNNLPLKGGAVASAFLVAGLAMQAGHAGAELVYKHNAGSAYSTPDAMGGGISSGGFLKDDDDD